MLIATEEEMKSIKNELLHHRQSGRILGVKIISKDGDSQKSLGYEATTLLHLAAKYGDTKVTQYLVDSGYNVDITNPCGSTPLMIAIRFDEHKVIRMLLDANADIFLRNRIGKSAAKLGLRDQSTALMILAKIKLICSNDSQATAKKLLEIECPLARATLLKDTSIVNYMLNNGRAVDEIDCHFSHSTALHYAVRLKDLNMVNLLLDRGVDVNVKDKRGLTPLCQYNSRSEETTEKHEILKTLLNKGASLTVPVNDGWTLANLLLKYGRIDTIRILLEHVGDLSSQMEKGVPLLHKLMTNCTPGISVVWKNKDWNFSVLDNQGRTALFRAAVAGSTESVGVLVKKGVDVNFITSRGVTALIYLSSHASIKETSARNRLKCAEILLSHGADAQYAIGEKITIFDDILRRNNFALAKIIIAHLALIEVHGEPIKELVIGKINSDIRFQKYFSLCKQWLGKMMKTVICGPITLFEFLTENERNMRIHARNQKLVSQLERIMLTQRRSTMYYCNILRRRIKTVIRNVELKKQVTNFVSENLELRNNDNLIEMIVEYSIDH